MVNQHSASVSLVLLLATVCGTNAVADTANADGGQHRSVAQALESRLEGIHGFGVAPQNALRDDTIALWETYRRDQIQRACMQQAGFSHLPELAFPATVVVSVAAKLKLPAVQAVPLKLYGGKAIKENQRYADALAAAQRERYFQSLYGESASDMDFVRSSGELPPGRADFAKGGCYGKSWEKIPGVYSLKHKFAESLTAARQSSAKQAELAASNPACVTQSGVKLNSLADFDAALQRGEDINAPIEAGCDTAKVLKLAGQARIAGENRLLEANREALDTHRAGYDKVLQTIERDQAFLQYLAIASSDLKREMETIEQQDHHSHD